jgi:hypothetical protein
MKTIAILMLMAAAAVAGDVPAEAAKLVEIREREINKINVAYLQKLDALLVDYRAKGNTEAVKVVEGLIAEVEDGNPSAMGKEEEPEEEETTRWDWGSGGVLTLQSGGKAKHSGWRRSGTWKKEADGGLQVLSDDGKVFKIVFVDDRVGKVVSLDGKGSTTITRKD